MSDYETVGDSISLAKIGEKPFTVTFIEDSDYTNGSETTPGVKCTIKETLSDVDGNEFQKIHTTRIAIVNKLKNSKIREDVNEKKNPLGPIKCIKEKTKAGKDFFNLVDA